jgi:hypothetical protein
MDTWTWRTTLTDAGLTDGHGLGSHMFGRAGDMHALLLGKMFVNVWATR